MCVTIGFEDVGKSIVMRRKERYLNNHENEIWQGSNGYYYTYVKSEGKRRLIKRKKKEDLENYIYTYYQDQGTKKTVGECFIEWSDWKIENCFIGRGTYNRYKLDYDRFILPLDEALIETITADDLDIYIRAVIRDNNLTAKAYSNLRTIIIGIFKWAKRQHYTDLSIGEFFSDFDISKKCFRHVKRVDADNVFSDAEVKKLMKWLRSNPTIENLGIIFAFQTGVRCGELAALKWEDISSDGLTIHVRRQEILYHVKTGVQQHEVVEYTKTEAGDRVIFLPTGCALTLNMARSLNRESEFIFAKCGRRINKTVYNTKLATACRNVGIPERTMHKIRKTYATALIDSDVEEIFVTEQLGHSSIETTKKYYYFTRAGKESKTGKINAAITF